ncbi:HAD domain-containing protein [Burkholderia sp. PU8-34]
MRSVLFLNFDGVLHRGASYLTPQGVASSAPGHIVLFEFALVLDELLRPYPYCQVVLSTDWCPRFGFERARAALPLASLRARVVDATFDAEHEDSATCLTTPRIERPYRSSTRRSDFEPEQQSIIMSLRACSSLVNTRSR